MCIAKRPLETNVRLYYMLQHSCRYVASINVLNKTLEMRVDLWVRVVCVCMHACVQPAELWKHISPLLHVHPSRVALLLV
jgi:hypothetical protein